MKFRLKALTKNTLSSLSNFISCYSLPLFAGFLIGTSYIPSPPWALFFCYTPLYFFALKQKKFSSLLIGGWLCQFIVTLIGFNWVAYSIKEILLSSWPVSLLGFFLFCCFANLHIPIALLLWLFSKKIFIKIKKPISSLMLLFLLPIYFSLSIEYYPMIFDWHLGYTWFYAKWPAAQTAEIWGFQFLNTLTLFFNLLFLFIFQALKKGLNIGKTKSKYKEAFIKTQKAYLYFFLGFIIFIGLNLYGLYLKHNWPEPDKKITTLIIQANIENNKQGAEDWSEFILSKILQETVTHFDNDFMDQSLNEKTSLSDLNLTTKQSTKKPIKYSIPVDFILWPEGTYPYPIDKEKVTKKLDYIQKWSSVFNTPLIVSAKGKTTQNHTNSLFAFDYEGNLIQAPYDKMKLIPFGEYAPWEEWMPFLGNLFFEERSFTPGRGTNKIINWNGFHIGFFICYEGLFDWITRDLALEGADILINVANDSWFGKWQEPYQHLYMTAARAIEVRRPLIRGTNSGFSAVVSAKGDISSPWILNKSLSWIESAFYFQENKRQTFFTVWGYYFNLVFLLFFWSLIHIYTVCKEE